MGKWSWTTQCQDSCPLWRQGPTNGRNEQMESDGFFLKTIMWHNLGYGIGCGSISPESWPPAIFLVLTPYNVQLLWSFLCITNLIQRVITFHSFHRTCQWAESAYWCMATLAPSGNWKKDTTATNMTFNAVQVYCRGKKTWVLHSSTGTLKIIQV
jgi:hypothetical protein